MSARTSRGGRLAIWAVVALVSALGVLVGLRAVQQHAGSAAPAGHGDRPLAARPGRGEAPPPAAAPRGRGAAQRGGREAAPPLLEPPAPSPGASDEEARRERDAFTLASYLDWAQYPPSSRPARERPDRLRPHTVSARSLPLAGEGESAAGSARVVLWQSHLYLAGPERATLTVACREGDAPAPCRVLSAVVMPEVPSPEAQAAPVPFTDDGAGADRQGGDGVWTAIVAPAELGLAQVTGPLRVALDVEAGGERGGATFALAYTANVPAVLTGVVRERLAEGSLSLCVGLSVREAGRYVLDARVDDASGETFAFLSFNDVLAAGEQEACFQVFGKLVRDEEAAAPFALRDVEGFLLLEDAFPDRHTVPTWEGTMHTTHSYAAADFLEDVWESETKARYVAGLRR